MTLLLKIWLQTILKPTPKQKMCVLMWGEIKFRGKNDQANLEHYKILDEKGLLKLNLQEQRKKFLSKDSVYIYLVTMTDQSKPFVLELDAHKATVKAINYVLDEGKPTRLEVKNGKTAKITVSLKKEKTDFAIFLKDKGTAGDFITKTYKLKFKKEEGWTIIGE